MIIAPPAKKVPVLEPVAANVVGATVVVVVALEMRKPPTVRWGVFKKIRRRPTLPGGDLQVPSAQVGLTAVFEMGTGVTPPPKPPETYAYVTLVTGSLILKRFIASTNIYNSKPSAD